MTIRRWTIIHCVITCFLYCCTTRQDTVLYVSGLVSNAPPHISYITRIFLDGRSEIIIDSIFINKLDHPFQLKIPVDTAKASILKFNFARNATHILLEDRPGRVGLKLNLTQLNSYAVNGSYTDNAFKQWHELQRPFEDSLYIIQNFISNTAPGNRKDSLLELSIELKQRLERIKKNFADTVHAPLVALKLALEIEFSNDLGFYKLFLKNLNQRFPQNQLIGNYIRDAKDFIRVMEEEYEVGDTLPTVQLNLINQEPTALDQLLKTNNLLYFWASYCPICIQDIQKLKKINQGLNSDEVNIIGCSLDPDSTMLIETLSFLNLSWPQAYDYKSWNGIFPNNYLIDKLPVYFLIDKTRRVLDKQNRFDDLNLKLLSPQGLK